MAAGRIPTSPAPFFLVDPLDGTKGFIKGRPEFTINIGLIEDAAAGVRPRLCAGAGRLLCDAGARRRPSTRASSRTASAAAWPIAACGRSAPACPIPTRSCALTSQSHLNAGDRALPRGLQRDRAEGAVLLAEVRPDRQGRGRPLPARRPDQRMGYGRRARRAGGGRRHGDARSTARPCSTATPSAASSTPTSWPGGAGRWRGSGSGRNRACHRPL